MGYSLSWLAVKGKPPDQVLDVLGLVTTGRYYEGFQGSPHTAATLPGGWYVVIADHSDEMMLGESEMRKWFGESEAVTCEVEDHCMVSTAKGWENGAQVWSAMHDGGQKGVHHIATAGVLPGAFEDIRKRLYRRQESADQAGRNVDYLYDLPAELAESIVGFRHDKDLPAMGSEGFAVLAPMQPGIGKRQEDAAKRNARGRFMFWLAGLFGNDTAKE